MGFVREITVLKRINNFKRDIIRKNYCENQKNALLKTYITIFL
jgi:hypothetical protein